MFGMAPKLVNQLRSFWKNNHGSDITDTPDITDTLDTETPDTADTPDVENAFRTGWARVREHLYPLDHLRILVIGRSNSGKTTLLCRICNMTELPEIFNAKGEKIDPMIVQGSLERGYHDVDDELIFKSNPGFVFHDSIGFELGSVRAHEVVKKFIMD